MDQLSENERKLVGFAIFSTAMKLGPSKFEAIERIIDKLQVREEFEFYAKDWIEYSNRKKESVTI